MTSIAMQRSNEELGATFVRLQHGLRSYLRRRVRDPALVEDLLQDVFVKALPAIRAERQVGNLTGWLYAVTRTTVVDYYRSNRPATEELDENIPDIEAEDDLLHQELATCLRPLLEQLPRIYRETLLATDFAGETMRSVANEQGMSLSAIKSRASRARAMLREQLLACCDVEVSDGTVVDYRRRSTYDCGGNCR